MAITATLQDLLIRDLQRLYQAGHQLLRALPKFAKAASNPGLRQQLLTQCKALDPQMKRLTVGLKLLGSSPSSGTCPAMAGLIDEAMDALYLVGPNDIRDAQLLSAVRRIGLYTAEIQETALAYARRIGQKEAAALLAETCVETEAVNTGLAGLVEGICAAAGATRPQVAPPKARSA